MALLRSTVRFRYAPKNYNMSNSLSFPHSRSSSQISHIIVQFLQSSSKKSSSKKVSDLSLPIFKQYEFWNYISKASLCLFLGSVTLTLLGAQISLSTNIVFLAVAILSMNRGITYSSDLFLQYLNLEKTFPDLHAYLDALLSSQIFSQIEFDASNSAHNNSWGHDFSFQLVTTHFRKIKITSEEERVKTLVIREKNILSFGVLDSSSVIISYTPFASPNTVELKIKYISFDLETKTISIKTEDRQNLIDKMDFSKFVETLNNKIEEINNHPRPDSPL